MKTRNFTLPLMFTFLLLTFLIVHSASIEWSNDKPAITLDSFDGASSITQTSDHKIWIVWQKEFQGHAIYYSTSSDYGASWTTGKNLTNVPNNDLNVDPSIIQLSNGSILVVWSALKGATPPGADFEMRASPSALTIQENSSDTSNITVTSLNNFNDLVNLSVRSILPFPHNITTIFDPPQVTPPPNGEVNSTLTINVGKNTTPKDYYITVRGYSEALNITRGLPEGEPINVTVTAATEASAFTTDDTGVPSSATSPQSAPNFELYYKISNDNGTSWSNEKTVPLTNSSGNDLGASTLQASNGTIWLVWSSSRTGNSSIFCKTYSDLTSWSVDTQLTSNSSNDVRPAIAQMDDGKIWVAWHSTRYGDQEILYKTYNGSWSDTFRLTNHTNMDTAPTILQTTNGTIRVFWGSSGLEDYDNWDIYYKESLNNGQNWTGRIQLTNDTNDEKWPGVTQSIDNRLWVTWTTNRTGSYDIFYRTSLVHSIAMTNVTSSHTQVYQEEIVLINVTLQNYGDYNETFTVNCYTNSTPIGPQNVSLISRGSTMITFIWNTSGFSRGDYRIKTNTSTVDGEAYIGDNTLTYGNVRVKLLGDVDDNGIVETSDLYALGVAYGSSPGNPNWNEEADMNGDNTVNTLDLSALMENYGKTG